MRYLRAAGLFLALVLLAGCAKPFVITTELTDPLQPPRSFTVADIVDQLPSDTPIENKPTLEDVGKFKLQIYEEFAHRGDLGMAPASDGQAQYEVRGAILGYKKGSGFLRFLIGFGAGKAEVTTQLQMIELTTDRVVFSGNFKGMVANWGVGGDDMFRQVAMNFTKQIEKRMKEMKAL